MFSNGKKNSLPLIIVPPYWQKKTAKGYKKI
jgi:hypothetical protein